MDLDERRECVLKLLETNHNFNFSVALEENQLTRIDNRLGEYEPFEDMLSEARELVDDDLDALMGYLYLRSARHVRRLGEPRNADLLKIVTEAAEHKRGVDRQGAEQKKKDYVTAFNKWCKNGDNLKKLLRIFPIIATTCISASRLGEPKAAFDLCVIDEASQCDTATALIPIVRAQNLALVGDPQQLNPVVTIDHTDNRTLMRSYSVPEEYDYVENSVYKVFLACDAVSNEILLRELYRCDENIIEYSNRKYYSSKLLIRSGRHSPDAVEFLDVEYDTSSQRNTAPGEAAAIVAYAKGHPEQSIGIITPFVNQSEYIKDELERSGVTNATCGTVHSFQGDEKDVILFSLGLTRSTRAGTYRWLCRNRELINVATSRARDRLVVVCNGGQVERLHQQVEGTDDLYELVQYVRSKGRTTVTPRSVASRALGVKPYSTRTEAAFLETLNHALDNIFLSGHAMWCSARSR